MSAFRLAVVAVLVASAAIAADPAPVKINDLSAPAPAGWKSEKPSNRLRSYQFRIPSGDKDVADGEVSVYPDSNKDAKKNHERWLATIVPPDGKTIEEISKVTTADYGTAKGTMLDVTGTWKYKERPQDPKSKEELRAEWRVIWVIIEGKGETTHVRFAAPMAVVEKHKKDFDAWLKALK